MGTEMTARQKVWLEAWIACASASNVSTKEVPAEWADRCLEDFDNRFGKPEPKGHGRRCYIVWDASAGEGYITTEAGQAEYALTGNLDGLNALSIMAEVWRKEVIEGTYRRSALFETRIRELG